MERRDIGMKDLLIYGTGNVYAQLKRIINWKEVQVKAFLETDAKKNSFEGVPLFTPEKYLEEGQKFDYILCASIYEFEMRDYLKKFGILENQIISGEMSIDNFLRYPDVFDIPKIIAYQNSKILAQTKHNIARNRFYDISRGVIWMRNLSLTAGGWAVGYDYMYVMLRVLQSKKPNTILELGLGQSSKILARYQDYRNCLYDIVEQDEMWYQFFETEFKFSNNVQVYIRPIKQVYNATYGADVNSYTDFHTVVYGKKYDFISIDGPWGSEKISRTDILPYIPHCLEDSFCIMMDDYERLGEYNMIIELENILKKNDIKYYKAIYGEEDKKICLITSQDNPFLCTLY